MGNFNPVLSESELSQREAAEAAWRQAIRDGTEAAWTPPEELIAPEAEEELVTRLAGVLTPVMQFIAKGRLTGTMEARSWVFLHETRLDLIGAESIEAYAKRVGVSGARIHALVREFRSGIPAYHAPGQASAASRAKMKTSARKRHARASAPVPPYAPASADPITAAGGNTDLHANSALRPNTALRANDRPPPHGGKESFSAPLPSAGSAHP